jgi:putative ABC transport system ATP-binding protein
MDKADIVMSLIALNQIVKRYQMGSTETTVLRQVSLTINQGEMVAIVGASGSGKSTLMNIIGLLDRADEGQYILENKDVAGLSSDELALLRNQHIGFIFQQFNLLQRFNAAQNVGLPLTYRNVAADFLQQKVHESLKRVGMETFLHHRPTQLSGGQQQRVAIARALIGEPRVILADEPTGALDSGTGKEIMNLFLNMHKEGRTIIIVTHDENIAAQCPRQITLGDGNIIADSAHDV